MPALTSDWLISNIHIGNPSLYSLSTHKSAPMREKGQLRPLAAVLFSGRHVYLSIESDFVGVHGPYELHRKEKQIECTAYAVYAVHENLLFSVGVHGPYINCIGKKGKLNAPLTRCMKICFSVRCNSYGPWTPTKCDSILIFTSFYNKVCRGIAYFNTKCHISQIPNVQKVRHLGQPAPGGWRTEQSRRVIQCK